MELKKFSQLVVRAEKDCEVYCPICHKVFLVEAGQAIPRCCGKPMEVRKGLQRKEIPYE